MRDTMKDSVVGAIVGAGFTGIVSFLIFILGNFSTQSTIEENIVKTLSDYFEIVNKDMTYEQAFQVIYKENKNLKTQIIELENQVAIINNNLNVDDKEIESIYNYPQNMTDVVPAYQSGGNTYREYTSKASGATEYFSMGGIKYTNGMTFNADINIFDDVSWAVYNLDARYNKLEFVLCHVDGTDLGNETFLEIFCDGQLKEEISLTPDMAPKNISIDISGVMQLKMQVRSSGNNNPLYGLGNPMIY